MYNISDKDNDVLLLDDDDLFEEFVAKTEAKKILAQSSIELKIDIIINGAKNVYSYDELTCAYIDTYAIKWYESILKWNRWIINLRSEIV